MWRIEISIYLGTLRSNRYNAIKTCLLASPSRVYYLLVILAENIMLEKYVLLVCPWPSNGYENVLQKQRTWFNVIWRYDGEYFLNMSEIYYLLTSFVKVLYDRSATGFLRSSITEGFFGKCFNITHGDHCSWGWMHLNVFICQEVWISWTLIRLS